MTGAVPEARLRLEALDARDVVCTLLPWMEAGIADCAEAGGSPHWPSMAEAAAAAAHCLDGLGHRRLADRISRAVPDRPRADAPARALRALRSALLELDSASEQEMDEAWGRRSRPLRRPLQINAVAELMLEGAVALARPDPEDSPAERAESDGCMLRGAALARRACQALAKGGMEGRALRLRIRALDAIEETAPDEARRRLLDLRKLEERAPGGGDDEETGIP